jgi:serine protease Do
MHLSVLPRLVLATFLSLALAACDRAPDRESPPAPPRETAPPSPGLSAEPGSTGSSGRYAAGTFQTVFSDVARQAVPSVVSITSERTVTGQGDIFGGDPFEFFFGPRGGPREGPRRRESGLGSGVIVSKDGTILTNNHVIEGAQKLTVQLADEREFEAEVVGTDPATDLAVIRIKDDHEDLPALELGNSDELLIGEWVVAVGAPFGLYETVTVGIVSAKGRQNTGITTYGNFIQTDAAINPGNSGGPLVNLDGKVIGINTAIYSQSGGYQGIGFAIPVNLARAVMEGLVKDGKVTRGWLGVSIQPLTHEMAAALGLPGRKGALVSDVLDGGPAEKAGMKRGDVITAIDGKEVADANDLMNKVALLQPGIKAELTVWRNGKETTLEARISKREEESSGRQTPGGTPEPESEGTGLSSLGLEAADLTRSARMRFRIGPGVRVGAVVTAVEPDGPAAEADIRAGDVILEAGRREITSVADLRRAVSALPRDKGILLLLDRQGGTFYAVVTPR